MNRYIIGGRLVVYTSELSFAFKVATDNGYNVTDVAPDGQWDPATCSIVGADESGFSLVDNQYDFPKKATAK